MEQEAVYFVEMASLKVLFIKIKNPSILMK